MLLSALKREFGDPTLHGLHLFAAMEVAMESFTEAAHDFSWPHHSPDVSQILIDLLRTCAKAASKGLP
ncbi:hypothetical protein P0D71_11485 [Paraburkholderia sp. RL17-383-BIF-A]|uniref:hypothetical protein n=1 Tax=Paraburkholderia sp. RL17-383-BIF-A TaxID=3031631 RepID=UPI0038BC71DB